MSYQALQGVQKISGVGQGGLDGIMPDVPDIPDTPGANTLGREPAPHGGLIDFGGLVESFKNVAPAIDQANRAESAFLSGKGNLIEMALERAKADTLLSLTAATASKFTQGASTLMNLQV